MDKLDIMNGLLDTVEQYICDAVNENPELDSELCSFSDFVQKTIKDTIDFFADRIEVPVQFSDFVDDDVPKEKLPECLDALYSDCDMSNYLLCMEFYKAYKEMREYMK